MFAALIFVASIAIFMLAPPTPDLTAAISAATSAAAAASKGSTGSDRIAGDTCEAGDEECRNASVAAAAATAAAAAEAGVQSAALWKVALEALVLAVTVNMETKTVSKKKQETNLKERKQECFVNLLYAVKKQMEHLKKSSKHALVCVRL